MAQRIQSQSLLPTNKSEDFPKTAAFFKWWEYVSEQIGHLVEKAEYPLFRLAFFLYLIYKLAEYGYYLFSNWHKTG